jgi:hypothetical protein
VAHPTACLGALVEPVCRGGRPGLPLTIGSPGLPLYLPYIYIYMEKINGSPGFPLVDEAPAKMSIRSRSAHCTAACVSHAYDSHVSRLRRDRRYTHA